MQNIPKDGKFRVEIERVNSDNSQVVGDIKVVIQYTGTSQNFPKRIEAQFKIGRKLTKFLEELVRQVLAGGKVNSGNTKRDAVIVPLDKVVEGQYVPTWSQWKEWGKCDGILYLSIFFPVI